MGAPCFHSSLVSPFCKSDSLTQERLPYCCQKRSRFFPNTQPRRPCRFSRPLPFPQARINCGKPTKWRRPYLELPLRLSYVPNPATGPHPSSVWPTLQYSVRLWQGASSRPCFEIRSAPGAKSAATEGRRDSS